MIRPSYALKLARTKLHSKRGMLITSVVVASLLFAILATAVIVFSGTEKSASRFVKAAGNDRYLVAVEPYIPAEARGYLQNLSIEDVREVRAFEKAYYDEIRAKYKSLNIPYDEKSEVPALKPLAYFPPTMPEEQRFIKDFSSPVIPAYQNYKLNEFIKSAKNTPAHLKEVGAKYGASGYFIFDKNTPVQPIPGARLIQNNKEDFSVTEPRQGFTSYEAQKNAVFNVAYTFSDQQLLSRFLLPTSGQELKGIPVVITAQEAASLFGEGVDIGKEPESPHEKIAWIQSIQTKLNGHTYQSCARSSSEQAMLDKIQLDYAEMKANENDNDYRKPSLIYDFPKEACGDILVKEDTRTTAEKKLDFEIIETQKKLGTYVEPAHHKLTFQIVGIKYAQPFLSATDSVESYVKSLLTTQNYSWSADIPTQLYNQLPDSLKFPDSNEIPPYTDAASNEFPQKRVLEFTSIEDARSFLNNETCPSSSDTCDKLFKADTHGSNYLIIDEIGKLFNRFASIAFPVVLGLAAIIIWFTISRIMADNRKETAVYRAMGARRGDVTSIYVTYVLIISLWILLTSAALSIAAGLTLDHFYGSALSDIAVTAFGIVDNAPTFSLFDLSSPLLPILAGLVIIISLVASIQPLARNVRRDPILDMRGE